MGQKGRWLRTGGIHKAACVRWELSSRFTLTAGMCGFNQNRPSVSLLQWLCSCAGLWLAGPLPCAQPRGSCQTQRGGTRCGKDTVSPEQMDCSVFPPHCGPANSESIMMCQRPTMHCQIYSMQHAITAGLKSVTVMWCRPRKQQMKSKLTVFFLNRHICTHLICKGKKYIFVFSTLFCSVEVSYFLWMCQTWFISCYRLITRRITMCSKE